MTVWVVVSVSDRKRYARTIGLRSKAATQAAIAGLEDSVSICDGGHPGRLLASGVRRICHFRSSDECLAADFWRRARFFDLRVSVHGPRHHRDHSDRGRKSFHRQFRRAKSLAAFPASRRRASDWRDCIDLASDSYRGPYAVVPDLVIGERKPDWAGIEPRRRRFYNPELCSIRRIHPGT